MPKTLTKEEIIFRAQKVHGDRYDYSKLTYQPGVTKKITVICSIHGEFFQTVGNHCKGSGCPKCGYKAMADHNRCNTKKFTEKAQQVHGDRYDYSAVNYTSWGTKVTIRCPYHGDFNQTPNSHWQGIGCPKCGHSRAAKSNTKTTEDFIREARKVHNEKYDYSEAIYLSAHEKVIIICPKHGKFLQTPDHHLRGCECTKCHAITSKTEDEIFEFISSLTTGVERSNRSIISPQELDIYIPNQKLAIEYCGLFWHSDYKRKDKNYHLNKHIKCQEKDIRLITIFEDEWTNKKEIVKAFLRHLLKKSEKGCFARNTIIKEITWKKAKDFLNRTHLLGAGTPGKQRIGAFDPDGNLIAVMTFGVPADERGKTDVVEMKRFCTNKKNNPGVGSKMFKWAVRHYGFKHVTAFVDRRWFIGEFKLHTGFEKMSETAPALFWTNFKERYHRRVQTKKHLLEMERFKDSTLTKNQMMNELGLYRIWDCGKLKLEWKEGGPKSPKARF